MSLKKLSTKHVNMALMLAMGADRNDVAEKYDVHPDTLSRLCTNEPLFIDEIERVQSIIREQTIAKYHGSVIEPILNKLDKITTQLLSLALGKTVSESVKKAALMDCINLIKVTAIADEEEGVRVPQLTIEIKDKGSGSSFNLIEKVS